MSSRLALAVLAACLIMPAAAIAQDGYGNGYGPDPDFVSSNQGPGGYGPTPYDRSHDDEDYARQGDARDDSGVPYAGRYLGYDYVTDQYYRWDGLPPQDHRTREQDGWRDGVLHTRPVGWRWYRYDNCGCGRYSYYRVYNWRGEHRYVQADPRQRDYRPAYTYSPRAYYRPWITSRSDFPW